MMREICASFELERRILKGYGSKTSKMMLWKKQHFQDSFIYVFHAYISIKIVKVLLHITTIEFHHRRIEWLNFLLALMLPLSVPSAAFLVTFVC